MWVACNNRSRLAKGRSELAGCLVSTQTAASAKDSTATSHLASGIRRLYGGYRVGMKFRASWGLRTQLEVAERYANTECGKYDAISRSYRLDPNGFCPTLRAGTGPQQGSFQAVRPIHPTEDRVITPREAARLQGFPDWFQFSPTKWHSFRQIGNSVSPILAEQILNVVARSLGITNSMEEQGE